jgi:hypothetical protein
MVSKDDYLVMAKLLKYDTIACWIPDGNFTYLSIFNCISVAIMIIPFFSPFPSFF